MQSFHHAILRTDTVRHQSFPQPSHRLMVNAVMYKSGPIQLRQPAALCSSAGVYPVRFILSSDVKRGIRQILYQITAEIYVDHLDASANTQDRFPGFYKRVHHIQLQFIQLFGDISASAVFLPKTGRVNITASRQQKPVKILHTKLRIIQKFPARLFLQRFLSQGNRHRVQPCFQKSFSVIIKLLIDFRYCYSWFSHASLPSGIAIFSIPIVIIFISFSSFSFSKKYI